MTLSNFDRYQRIAWAYDFLDLPFEYMRYRKIRPQMFSGLSGRILDAGVGTEDFPFYSANSEVIGIDLSPAMPARAKRRLSTASTSVELRVMDVTRLDFPDRYFDAAVATFLFCTLPDELQVAGMRELGRVVSPAALFVALNTPVQAVASAERLRGFGNRGSTGPMGPVSTGKPKSMPLRQG